MRLDSIPRVLAVISCVAVLALFAGPLLSAVAAPPQVTVFLKNYHEEYNRGHDRVPGSAVRRSGFAGLCPGQLHAWLPH